MIDQIKADMLTARKAKKSKLVSSMALLISEIERIGKNDGNRATTKDEAIAVIKKMVLRGQELHNYLDVGPMRDATEAELEMLNGYLPTMVTEDDVKAFISDKIDDGATHIGQLMGALKKEYGQTVDMKAAGGIAKQMLEKNDE